MRRLTVLTFVAFAAACSSKPAPPPPPPVAVATPVPTPAPAAVGTVTLGSEVGADKAIVAASAKETFGVKDKVFASVTTTGVGKVKLRGLWSFVKGDKTTKVNETTIEFDATGPATNEFHIENTKDWPKGDYKLDVFFNDGEAPAVTKTFKVA